MRSPNHDLLTLLLSGLLAMAAVVADFAVSPAIAQDSKTKNGDDRSDSGQRRRGWGSWRRDRDRDEVRADRRSENSSDGDDRSEGDSKGRESGDSSGMTPETYAKQLVDKLDKNDNKVLDGEEISGLTGPARAADFNKDGFISREEVAASLANPAATSPAPPASTGGDRPNSENKDKVGAGSKAASTSRRVFTWLGGSKPGADAKDTRRTYRFTPARERLPSELPSWFKSQDKNGDGQVAMSEYSRSWTKSTVAKFQGYDTNSDGVVTAKEVKEKK